MKTKLEIDEIKALGLAEVGTNVHISPYARFYGASRIKLGNHVRIDDFCILSAGLGGIEIGDYIHIAAYSSIMGRGRVVLSDFSTLSSKVSVYSSTDDFSGLSLTNPMVPDQYKAVKHADVFLGRHVIVGAGSVILPGVTLEDGVAVGALSLVNKNCQGFGIYAGIPVKRIGERKRNLLILEQEFINSLRQLEERSRI
jgi:galactoside O-acetyltransferase